MNIWLLLGFKKTYDGKFKIEIIRPHGNYLNRYQKDQVEESNQYIL